MTARLMTARYNGRCLACGGRITKGETISYSREEGARHAAPCVSVPDFYEPEDWETRQARRDEAEYQRGYHEVAQIQAFSAPGSALREQMYAEMETAAYNRGED